MEYMYIAESDFPSRHTEHVRTWLWFQIFAKKGGEQKHIKGVLDLKDSLQKMKEKISRLRIMKSSKPIAEKDKGYYYIADHTSLVIYT